MRYRVDSRLSLAVLLIVLIPGICSAGAFDPIASGARACGMGGAYTAAANDPGAVYWNPAGLADVRRPTLAVSHLDIESLGLLSYDQFIYTQPFVFNSSIAVSWLRMGTTGLVTFLNYTENTFILSYQQSLWDVFSLGLNMKVFQVQYDQSASGFGLDLGVRYKFKRNLSIALMAENINRPEIYWLTGTYERLPINLRAGLAGYIDGETTLALDVDRLLDKELQVHFGAERWFFTRRLALRAGVAYLSQENRFTPSGGLGFRISFLEFGYAYSWHIDLDGNHVLSLNWGF